MRLVDESVNSIMAMTGHPSPDMGGSAAALLAGHLGLSMLRMALAVSANQVEKTAPAAEYASAAERIAAKLADAADRDLVAFRRYLQAVKQPHGPGRTVDLAKAEEETLDELLASALLLVEAMELAARCEAEVKATVKSDLYGAGTLLHAAFSGVSLALQFNLSRPGARSGHESIIERLDSLDARRKKASRLLSTKASESGFTL